METISGGWDDVVAEGTRRRNPDFTPASNPGAPYAPYYGMYGPSYTTTPPPAPTPPAPAPGPFNPDLLPYLGGGNSGPGGLQEF